MHARFEKRIEEGLSKLVNRLGKAKKEPDRTQVERQIGRLLGKNSRAAGLFDIRVDAIERDGRPGLQVTWTKKEQWRQWAVLSEGCYLLRTNLRDRSAQDLWQTYIQLTQAESAFRTHKERAGPASDLAPNTRPRPSPHPLQLPGLRDVQDAGRVDGPQSAGPRRSDRDRGNRQDQAQRCGFAHHDRPPALPAVRDGRRRAATRPAQPPGAEAACPPGRAAVAPGGQCSPQLTPKFRLGGLWARIWPRNCATWASVP